MFAYHDAGFTTWDLADHYGPAEDFIGAFRRRFAAVRGAERLAEIQAFTKWVPLPGPMTRRVVEACDRRVAVGAWASTASTCCSSIGGTTATTAISTRSITSPILRDEGKIRHLALTNFDTERLRHHRRARHPHRLEPGAVFAGRPSAGGADGGVLPRSQCQRCSPTAPCSAGCCRRRYLGRPGAAAGREPRHGLLAEIQAT